MAAGVFVAMLAVSVPASADSFTAQFFKVSTSTAANSDFHPGNVPYGDQLEQLVRCLDLLAGMPVYNTGE